MTPKDDPKYSLCDHCGAKPAEKVIQIIEGKTQKEIHLCKVCSLKAGIVPDEGGGIAPQVGELFGAVLNPAEEFTAALVCETCGTTFHHLRATGIAGCADCYQIFREQISRIRHGSGEAFEYGGRYPQRLQSLLDIFTSHSRNRVQGDEHGDS